MCLKKVYHLKKYVTHQKKITPRARPLKFMKARFQRLNFSAKFLIKIWLTLFFKKWVWNVFIYFFFPVITSVTFILKQIIVFLIGLLWSRLDKNKSDFLENSRTPLVISLEHISEPDWSPAGCGAKRNLTNIKIPNFFSNQKKN